MIEEDFPLINNIDTWPEGWLIAPCYGRFNLELIVFFSENYVLCIASSPSSDGDPR